MDAGQSHLDALANHLAHRFPDFSSRSKVARDAGLGDGQLTGSADVVWGLLVRHASEQDKLGALLAAAARERPQDAEIMEIARRWREGERTFSPPMTWRTWARPIVIAGAIVATLGAFAIFGDATRARPQAQDTVEDQPHVAAVDHVEGGKNEELDVEPEPDAEPEPDTEPTTLIDEIEQPAPASPATAKTRTSGGGVCRGPRGERVGYAYAGTRSPGKKGDIWLVRRSTNVRSDYPRSQNQWDAAGTVRCVLPAGSRVELKQAPIAVQGGAYWVPVMGGAVAP